jgi:16S rRNA (uracil1498-N3)-methyltransferase
MSKASINPPRFLASALGQPGDEVVLPPDEAHHLIRVLRLRVGDSIVLFDGRGREFAATISATGHGVARAILTAPQESVAEAVVPFSLVQAVLKGGGMDDVVRDATMIGVARIEPVVSAHVAVKPSIPARQAAVSRWRRIALASAKQCRRSVVPAVSEVCTFDEWLSRPRAELTLMLVEPSAARDALPMRALLGRGAPRDAALMVGPEGGWSAEEIRAGVSAGALTVTLGRLTLRADAVALAAGALFRFLWEDA